MGGTPKEGGGGNSYSLGHEGCLTPDTVLQQLNKVLASHGFANANRLRRFLQVIVERAVSGHEEELKEYAIGISVFDREESFDPRIDPIVRVEAGRLRHRLQEYYRSEGAKDPVLIEVPKGHYLPIFHSLGPRGCPAPQPLSSRLRQANRFLRWANGWAIVALVAGLAALMMWSLNRRLQRQLRVAAAPSPEFSEIWGPFAEPGASNVVVFGTPLFFRLEGTEILIGSPQLSQGKDYRSAPGFLDLQRRFGRLSNSSPGFVSLGNLIAVQRLVSYFGQNGAHLRAEPAHKTTWASLRDHNLIFLGLANTNPLLAGLPVHQDFEWMESGGIRAENHESGEEQQFEPPPGQPEFTYALLGRYPGLRLGREIQLLSARGAPGTLAAVDFVTRTESLRQVSRLIEVSGTRRKYYEILLRVFVNDDTFVRSEYVTHHLVPPLGEQP